VAEQAELPVAVPREKQGVAERQTRRAGAIIQTDYGALTEGGAP